MPSEMLRVDQVTKSAATVNAKTSPRFSKNGSPEEAQDQDGQEEQESGPEAPPVGTLLDFVAWVVLTGHPALMTNSCIYSVTLTRQE